MLRELSQLLGELHDGLGAIEARAGVQLANVEMTLPLELRAILRGGGCVLLADVPRSRENNDWTPSTSRMTFSWGSDAAARHSREGGNAATLDSAHRESGNAAAPAFARHSGESGNPWTLPFPSSLGEHEAGSMDSRLRGNDGPDNGDHGNGAPGGTP